MKTELKTHKNKKRKLSESKKHSTLDETIENIFESIDEHLELRNASISQSSIHKDGSKPEGSIQTCEPNQSSSKKSKSKLQQHIPSVDANSIDGCVILNENDLKKALALLKSKCAPTTKEQKTKLKLHSICHDGYDYDSHLINWQSSTFTVRAIRNMILNRDWDHLKELLRIMLKHTVFLKNYVKELTYLYFLINADQLDPVKIEDYFLFCFSTCKTTNQAFKEFDIWFKEERVNKAEIYHF